MKSVLIVDDDDTNCFVFSKILEQLGYQTKCATNGYNALNIALTQPFNLVILDIRMPVMNGYECSDKMLDMLGKDCPPIIAITATTSPKPSNSIKTFISKPCSKSDIKNAIKTYS